MRFAHLRVRGQVEFAFAADRSESYFLWKDYAAKFTTDKIVSKVRHFQDFLSRSEILLEHFNQNSRVLEDLTTIEPDRMDFDLVLQPLSFRDFYCFEEHVMNSRKLRGLEMVPEWYKAPTFYYSNPLCFLGPNAFVPYPKNYQELDFELEIAAVVGRELYNATLEEAEAAIFGYSLLNDWSLREVWRNLESKVGMGPAKAKDFATSFGSYVVTKEELSAFRSGKGYDIEVEVSLNKEVLSRNNWKKISFSFAEMLVRASENCRIFPGEVLGSGTVGLGCLFEMNLPKKPEERRWLQVGDEVEMRWLPKGPSLKSRIV